MANPVSSATKVPKAPKQVPGESLNYPKMRFRCADVGYRKCPWQLEGYSAEAMLATIKKHAAEVHHLELKEQSIRNVRNAIHDAA